MPEWTIADILSQTGRIAVITGASSGIGAAAAEALAGKGAEVVLAVRDQSRGEAIRSRILAKSPGANITVSLLDLADLSSVRAFAGRMDSSLRQVDVLLNNAGLGMQAVRATTVDGFERQFGTNHLGHFALTGLLVPALLRAPAPRVVTIASLMHRRGRIDFGDLQGARHYAGGKAYNQSKLANLMFALELDARARAARPKLTSVAAHPGLAITGFVAAIGMPAYQEAIGNFITRLVGQDAAHGALPGLYAATMPDVKGGQYWGPDGLGEMRGAPALAKISAPAQDRETRQRLWAVSEVLTGVRFPMRVE
jgi:NAD(P)-dependent dehydrogenase (short-subunit alcohol dehydrogenase family)